MNKAGRPPNPNDPRRIAMLKKLGLPVTKKRLHGLRVPFMDQLDRCKDDASRRLLLRWR